MAVNMMKKLVSPELLLGETESFETSGGIAEGEVYEKFGSDGRGVIEGGTSSWECSFCDLVDCLPVDPLGMGTGSKMRAIETWLDDSGFDHNQFNVTNGVQTSIQFVALDGLPDEVRNREECPGNVYLGYKSDVFDGFDESSWKKASGEVCSMGFAYVEGLGEYSADSSGSDIFSDFDGGSAHASFDSDLASRDSLGLWSGVQEGSYASYPMGFGVDDCIWRSFQELKPSCVSHSQSNCANGLAGVRISERPGISDQWFPEGDGGSPHMALSIALSYLGVRDLLLVERVCTSFHSAVRGDPLLWQNICIDKPLNEKITDDILLDLTSRSQGSLRCLSLAECPKITDDCVRTILESNPRLSKLSVSGCTRIRIDGVINNLRASKSNNKLQLKHLRVGGLYGISQAHFEELKILVGIESQSENNLSKPHYYGAGNIYLSLEDDRALDMELCPRCQNPRLVYDCPLEVPGRAEVGPAPQCRACTLCVARCVKCGRCINESGYEETFCLELLCSSCSNEPILLSPKSPGEEGFKATHYSFSFSG